MHKFLKLLFVSLLACSVFLTGCGSSVPIVKPFKMDIQQGNVVTSKMLLQLKPGMTKSQVKFIMGTPLIVDSFHSNRWDYFYQMRQAGKIKEQRRVILDFENELLARVRGDVVPEGTAGAASSTEVGAVTLPKSIEPKPKEEGLLDKLKFWKKDPKAAEAKPDVKPAAKSELKEVAPIEPPKTEASGTDVSEPTGDTPPILVVPIGGVAPSVPEANVPEVTAPVIEEPKVEAPKVETPKVESPKKIEPVNTELRKAAPIKSAEPAPAPDKPAAATKEDPYILRIDRNLDANNLETAPIESVPTAKPKKADVPPPPPEEEPGYFEKMLEKIGF